jgi:hypothetical protein
MTDLIRELRNGPALFDVAYDEMLMTKAANELEKQYKIVHELIPVLDTLQERLEAGCTMAKQDGFWCLFDKQGELVCHDLTIRGMLVNLIFVDSYIPK